jgi:DNA mismatch repair ATPase MutS
MIIARYFDLQKQYEEEYGKKTVVLYQIGVFYEIYEYDPANCESEKDKIDIYGNIHDEHIGHVVYLSDMFNIRMFLKDKRKSYSFNNCMTAGFPCVVSEKYIIGLTQNKYTVIIVDRIRNENNDFEEIINIRRELGG